MEIIGHIKIYGSEETLCGLNGPVKETSLYGKQCGNCAEIATNILKGYKLSKLLKNRDL